MNNWSPSAKCSMSICFLALLLQHLPHCLALVQKRSSPWGHLLILLVCYWLLNFSEINYLETLRSILCLFLLYPQSFTFFLISFSINLMKSCSICRRFSPAGIWFSLDGLHGFFYSHDCILNGVILPYVLYIRILIHGIDNPFHRVLCVMNLKGLYDPLYDMVILGTLY